MLRSPLINRLLRHQAQARAIVARLPLLARFGAAPALAGAPARAPGPVRFVAPYQPAALADWSWADVVASPASEPLEAQDALESPDETRPPIVPARRAIATAASPPISMSGGEPASTDVAQAPRMPAPIAAPPAKPAYTPPTIAELRETLLALRAQQQSPRVTPPPAATPEELTARQETSRPRMPLGRRVVHLPGISAAPEVIARSSAGLEPQEAAAPEIASEEPRARMPPVEDGADATGAAALSTVEGGGGAPAAAETSSAAIRLDALADSVEPPDAEPIRPAAPDPDLPRDVLPAAPIAVSPAERQLHASREQSVANPSPLAREREAVPPLPAGDTESEGAAPIVHSPAPVQLADRLGQDPGASGEPPLPDTLSAAAVEARAAGPVETASGSPAPSPAIGELLAAPTARSGDEPIAPLVARDRVAAEVSDVADDTQAAPAPALAGVVEQPRPAPRFDEEIVQATQLEGVRLAPGQAAATPAAAPAPAREGPRAAPGVTTTIHAGPGTMSELDVPPLPGARGAAPLREGTRRFLRPLVGVDPADVRVHRDEPAGRVAAVLGADAAAIGQEIVLGVGYTDDTPAAQALIAHELTHVARAREARFVPPLLRGDVAAAGDEEALAAAVEQRVADMARARVNDGPDAGAPGLPSAAVSKPAGRAQMDPGALDRARWDGLPAPWEPLPAWMSGPAPQPAVSSGPAPAPETAPASAAQTPEPSVARAEISRRNARPAAAPALPPQPLAPAADPDLDTLARQVYAVLKRRLAAERRRHGW